MSFRPSYTYDKPQTYKKCRFPRDVTYYPDTPIQASCGCDAGAENGIPNGAEGPKKTAQERLMDEVNERNKKYLESISYQRYGRKKTHTHANNVCVFRERKKKKNGDNETTVIPEEEVKLQFFIQQLTFP